MTLSVSLPLCDADSHLMEPPGWLAGYADPTVRPALEAADFGAADGGTPEIVQRGIDRLHLPESGVALDRGLLGGPKGWEAFGAMDPDERARSLDALGLDAQFVFSTFATSAFASSRDLDVVYGGARAHNRGITDFCSADPRLLAVGFVPLDDIGRAMTCLDDAVGLGCRAVWIPHRPAAGVSPGHLDWDPFWARLTEAGVPFVLHIGGGRTTLTAAFHDNGRPRPPDFLGGGENLRAKDFPSAHHGAETFLTVMILDAVFDRHPGLRGGVIELGASWVPAMMANLDAAQRNFGKREPVVAGLELAPSEYVRRNLRFTPFQFEDVGWLIEQAGPELFLFSTDYPHPEGGRDPIGRFQASLDAAGIAEPDRVGFWAENFGHLLDVVGIGSAR